MTDLARDVLELETGPLAAGGGCVARSPAGQVVFVRHALPGERVRAVVTEATRTFLRADAVEVLDPSPWRVAPPCPAAGPGRCGGCDLQHVELAEQRRLKAALVEEQLARLARLRRPVEVEEVPGAPEGLGWRTRIRYGIDEEGRTGLRRHRSHDLEPVGACPLATDEVARVGAGQLTWKGTRSVEVFAPPGARPLLPRPRRGARGPASNGLEDEAAIVLVGADQGTAVKEDLPRLGTGVGLVLNGRTLRRPGALAVEVAGHRFEVSAGSFWQVHLGAPALLAEVVLSGLAPRPGESAADLYAGVGLFSVLLAEAVGPEGRVLAIERHRRSSRDAAHNLARFPAAEVRREPVSPRTLATLGPVDLVVLDPPREGAGTALMTALTHLEPVPRRVAYVACDPASFARDLSVVLEAGWSLASLRAFDLFPMTEHVELVAILEPPARRAGSA